MRTANRKAFSSSQPRPLKEFNKRRPRWVDPQEFLPGSLQNLFELSYFSDYNSFNTAPSLIPSGWRSIEDDSALPRLSSRAPVADMSDQEDAPTPSTLANGTGTDNDSSGDESVRQPPVVQAPTRMVDEGESDEDELASPQAVCIHADGPHNPTNAAALTCGSRICRYVPAMRTGQTRR